MMRIGYHYTSLEIWRRIRREGIIPSKIDHYLGFPGEYSGTWLWRRRPGGLFQAGIILRQIELKGSGKIVELKVRYNEKDVFSFEGQRVVFHNTLTIGEMDFGERSSIIVTAPIPNWEILFIKKYDIKNIKL